MRLKYSDVPFYVCIGLLLFAFTVSCASDFGLLWAAFADALFILGIYGTSKYMNWAEAKDKRRVGNNGLA